jgi:hypothetical protein
MTPPSRPSQPDGDLPAPIVVQECSRTIRYCRVGVRCIEASLCQQDVASASKQPAGGGRKVVAGSGQ